jgi:hypothetical protein
MGDSTRRDGPWAGPTTRASGEEAPPRRTETSAFNFRQRADGEGIAELLRDLTEQGSHLAQQQAHLVEAEVHAAIGDLKESIAAMAGAAVVAIAGLGVLLMAVSFLLGTAMPLWLGTLIVAVATMAGAYAMFASGKKKLQSKSMTMDRTRHTLERAPSAMSGNESEVQRGR